VNHLDYITTEPPNASVFMADLDGSPLSQDRVYMRNSFPMPDREQVTGEIRVLFPGQEARTVASDELGLLPHATIDMVLECAGNGRSLMSPVPSGLAWGLGGVSPIRVSGVRLTDVVGHLPEHVLDLVFTGADQGVVGPEGRVNYQFSLDAALARSGTPLLVTHIGDESLAHEHGGPVRLVVPGHYAMKSVKWLTRIEAVTEPFTGHFVNRYRYIDDHEFEDGAPVREIQVRSVISHPEDGATLPAGRVPLQGAAWSGTGSIGRVEVSTDNGETWVETMLSSGRGDHAARAWALEITVSLGQHTVMVRATDSTGRSQPLGPRWNKNGYANNLVHAVRFTAI
jgi:DMSO/TMAO reductase YedYZ molybdopterin-dependent catalytic subunit